MTIVYRGNRVRWTEPDGRVRTGTVVRGPRRVGEDDYDLDADVRPDDAPSNTVLLRPHHIDEVL